MTEEALPTESAIVPDAPVAIAAFDSARAEIAKWAAIAATIKITDASQTREMKLARDSRLGLVKVRTGAEKVKKDLKGDILKRANAIDAAYNELVSLIKPIEATLLEAEKYGEKLEAERLAKVRAERETVLHRLEVHPAAFPAALDTMSNADWMAVFAGHTAALEGKRAAEKSAEETRVLKEKTAAEERERQRVETLRIEKERRVQAEENARLRAEAEARETQMIAERQAAEEAARVERERVEALIHAVEEEARVDRERIEAARVAAETVVVAERKKAEADRQAELARIEAERQAERDKAMEEVRRLAAEHQAEQEKVEALRRAEQEKAEATLAEARRLFESQKAAMDRTVAAEAEARKPTRAKYATMVTALKQIAAGDEPKASDIAVDALIAVGEE